MNCSAFISGGLRGAIDAKMAVVQSARMACLGLLMGGFVGAQTPGTPDAVRATSATPLESIVVTGKRLPEPATDDELTRRVVAVLHDDPYFYDEHVTVTVKNGVAILQGIVFDEWDLRQAIRLARRIAGVRRVVDDLEIKLGGE